MKIRENCYMLGLGSTGGKIYKEFVQRHYKGAAANGSEQDHKALGDVPNKYILQGFDGFGGHRERAMDCLAGNEDFIKFVEGIKEDIVFILFAGGGSTGSGCAPIVAEMLLEEKDEEGNPVKTVCPVIALPASGESLAKHKNAYETVQELQEIEGLGATFFLNNDSNENYDYINKNFASMLDEFLSNESYGRQNNFDESERLEMLKDSGAMVLSVTGDGTDSKIKLEKLTKSGIFAPIEDNYICENIGIIHSKNDKSDIDSEDVIAEVGKPDNVFEGFNGRKTIIAASGLDYPVSHVKKLGELAVKANAERMRNKKSTRAKNIDLAKAHGDYEKSSDYDTKISNTQAEMAIKQNELDELTKQLDDGVEAGTIVENSQEWLDMQTKIKEAQNAVADYDTQIEELKQSQIGVYYEEQFKRAAEKVDRFRDKLDGLKSLISDDMKIDKNTGLLTESGALSITLDVDDINASTENLKTYIKERQQIINDYNAGKFGEDEYNQKLKDVDANIKSTTANIYSSRNSILELVKSQSQAELDVLNKVIDKRKEALSAKKNYYDYDKTLKNKTKDIEVLERQIAALEGSTSAEDKARKAKLQEQLDSAKEDLNDTITDHAYSMQTDALDKLSADMSEDLDKWINTISSNMEEMTTAINDAVKNAGLSTAGTINAISSILRHYRLSDSEISQSGLTNITGYASGTNYVNKSGIYRVNEKGMESVFSKQYGTLTFLNQGDKVFDANFTKQLLDNSTIATQKNMPDYAGMAKAIEKNIQNIQNLSGNTYVNNFYIDGAQDTESILREIDKHLDKKIQAHDKKQVRDFKSLR